MRKLTSILAILLSTSIIAVGCTKPNTSTNSGSNGTNSDGVSVGIIQYMDHVALILPEKDL